MLGKFKIVFPLPRWPPLHRDRAEQDKVAAKQPVLQAILARLLFALYLPPFGHSFQSSLPVFKGLFTDMYTLELHSGQKTIN